MKGGGNFVQTFLFGGSLEKIIVCESDVCSYIGQNNKWKTFAKMSTKRKDSAFIVINDKVVNIKFTIVSL